MTTANKSQVGGDHYSGMAIQPGVFCQKNRIPFFESIAIKYLCRHSKKGGEEDLRKAIHSIELAIEEEYGSSTDADVSTRLKDLEPDVIRLAHGLAPKTVRYMLSLAILDPEELAKLTQEYVDEGDNDE